MEPSFYKNSYNYYFPNRYRYYPYMNNNYYSHASHSSSDKAFNFKGNDFTSNNNQNIPPLEGSNVKTNNNLKKPIFELFGIKLFFDDILLISLIFFLYNEGVKDRSLFIALILLLLS